MIDKKKIYYMLGLRMFYDEQGWEQPNYEKDFQIPMTEELSKNIDETIEFLEELNANNFILVIEVLDELIEKTQSHKLICAIKRIGKEKNIDEKWLNHEIELSSQMLQHKI